MEQNGLFNDFETASHKQWKDKIITDLKGKDFESTLVWKDENNINHQPIYSANNSSYKELIEAINSAQKKSKIWGSVQLFDAKSTSARKDVENSLNNGADYAFIRNTEDYKQFSKLKVESNKRLYYFIDSIELSNLPKRFLLDPVGEILKNNPNGKTNLEKLPKVFQLRLNDLKPDHFLMVDGTIYKNAGATIIQELAYTLQHTTEYLDLMTEAGFTSEAIARSFIFRLGFGTSYFSEIAKGRAFQYLIKKIFEHYSVTQTPIVWGEASMYYHGHKDAHTNLLRSTTQGMSIVLGNCNLMNLPAFDEMEAASSLGMRMAKNVPLILKDESFFEEVRDAASGAYYIEELTAEIVTKTWNLFLNLEKEGTIIEQFESGKLKADLQKSHEKRLKSFQNKERTLLGVNKHPNAKSTNLNVNLQNTNGIPSRILSIEIDA